MHSQFLLVLLFRIFIFFHLSSALEDLKSYSDISKKIRLSEILAVVGVYNSKLRPTSRSTMTQILELLEKDLDLQSHSMEFLTIDMKRTLGLRDASESSPPTMLFLLIGSHRHIFAEFSEISEAHYQGKMTTQEVAARVRDWLMYRARKLHRAIKSREKLDHRLEKHRVVALFLGHKRSLKEENIFKLAMDHSSQAIYRIHNRTLAAEFYRQHSGRELGDQELFCVYRHPLLHDELDRETLHCIPASSSYRRYDHFFNSERHPRLLTNKDVTLLSERVFTQRHKLFMYVHNNASDPLRLKQFRHTIQRLPKSFVYLALNLDEAHDPAQLYNLFHNDISLFEPGTLYGLERSDFGASATPMEEPMTEQNIIGFVRRYYQARRYDIHHKDQRVIERHLDSLTPSGEL